MVKPTGHTDFNSNNMNYLYMMAERPFRCSVCKRICGWINKDGICGSPVCNPEVKIQGKDIW